MILQQQTTDDNRMLAEQYHRVQTHLSQPPFLTFGARQQRLFFYSVCKIDCADNKRSGIKIVDSVSLCVCASAHTNVALKFDLNRFSFGLCCTSEFI